MQHNKSPSAAASAPGDADSAATRVQHNMPPSAAASASGDADSAATLSAAQLATQTRSSRSKTSEVQIEDSSNNPELKKLNRCNYSYKRQCGLLGLLDECTKTTCSLVSFKSEHVCEFVMFVTLCSHVLVAVKSECIYIQLYSY